MCLRGLVTRLRLLGSPTSCFDRYILWSMLVSWGIYHSNSLRYMGFILSPWTLIAGPIQRYDSFCTGLETIGRPETKILKGAHRIINGLLLAFVAAPLFLEPSRISNLLHPEAQWIDFLVVFYGFPFYLYLNFAGYTSIMVGCARICGFSNLPENFNHPYLASNTWIFGRVGTCLSDRGLKRTCLRQHVPD